MQTLENYALAYASKGFYVLPMAAVDKRPLVEFADRPPMTQAELKQAWRRHPNARIAFRTVDFLVVDIDEHTDGEDGIQSFRDYYAEHPEQFPETLSQTTGSGGTQLFYKKPAGIEMTQVIGWLPGVDIKAHVNNYVMVAPSPTTKGGYKWDNRNQIALAPTELIDAINGKKQQEYKPIREMTQTTLGNQEQQFGQHSKTAELFEQIANGLGETGGRNMALAAFIGGLLYRNVDAKAVYTLAQLANDNTSNPLDVKEFDRTFDSMVKKELRRRNGG
ncbi:bifunctional DNA primase/polymerase [Lacticaseibacillus brantae]|uniref:DNA primase n=1 Tax=Lacticaseibacillus brantae DSM 23927 TaxID=1423727 RepID=A0A0R2B0L8_9LACO|nr:bifunctional DNA primase/polymerase [Lacticaseibacillus brantae]KRM73032.1 hypothetical protein FC34_GL000753 [Lacticaseibacillus brantae DSM 23927]